MNSSLDSKKKYRAELDGVRAIAVLLATGFQFFRNIFPFGYLGVDIFAVVSGYVITSSLASRKENNFKDFTISFYKRRIKRLLPALLIFILIASFITLLIHPNPGVPIRTAFYSLTGMSNIYLINIFADYFAASSELNPFTQTWSLGVEEQFYFIFPFLIWFTGYAQSNKRGFRNFATILVFSFSLSFVGFIFIHLTNPTFAYFYTPTRLWQMIIGALSFLAWERKNNIYNFFQKIPSLFITLVLILVTMNKLDDPLISTISITLLASALLLSLRKNTFTYNLFTNNISRYLAKISYSLYLWRWAIASFLLWTVGIGFYSKLIGILILFIIADLSSRLFENPKRSLPKLINKTGIIYSLLLLELPSMISVIALEKIHLKFLQFNYKHANLLTRSRNDIKLLDNSLESKTEFFYKGKNCHLNPNEKNKRNFDLDSYLKKCSLISNNNDARTIFFVGSSHTDHFRESHFLLFKNENLNISSVSISSCSFFSRKDISLLGKKDLCGGKNSLQERISDYYLKKAKKGDIFVVSSRYSKGTKSWLEEEDQMKFLKLFNEKLKNIGAHFVLVGPTPVFKKNASQCIQNARFSKINYLTSYDNCYIYSQEIYKDFKSVYDIIYKMPKNIKIFDPIPFICFQTKCSLLDKESKPIFIDNNHLTDYANQKYIYPALRDFFSKNNLL